MPIYDAWVWLVVADDMASERKKMDHVFGGCPQVSQWMAVCTHNDRSTFGLFFSYPRALTLEVVSHEVFHLTHRILEWSSANFDSQHHEQGALLCGWLTTLVHKEMKRAGLKMRES